MARTVPEPVERFKELRTQALSASWRKLKLGPTAKNPNVWGVLIEVGYPQAVVTLVCSINGTIDFYFGNGGGITGAGKHESARMKAEEFINAAEILLPKLNPAKKFPLPEINRVRFYILTFTGIRTAQDSPHIAEETHELFPLFRGGHEVIAALRALDDAGQLERIQY